MLFYNEEGFYIDDNSLRILFLFKVYKSQITRVTDGWNGKIDDFERINLGLQASLTQLRDENELLRLQARRTYKSI